MGTSYYLCRVLLSKDLTTWTSACKINCRRSTTRGRQRAKFQLHHLGDVVRELNLFFTQAKALGDDVNKGAASPPWVGGLQAQSRFLPRLRPWVAQIKFPLHHLGVVACELSLASYTG